MARGRDHCPDCEKKLHPQEVAALLSGKKLDCWYCTAPLKASTTWHLSAITQMAVGAVPLIDTFVGNNPPPWLGYAFAGLIIAALYVLPPGLVHGAPWVKIVTRKPV
jgi:uncharacterized paraquat-inducible protein A